MNVEIVYLQKANLSFWLERIGMVSRQDWRRCRSCLASTGLRMQLASKRRSEHNAYIAIVDDLEVNRKFLEKLSRKIFDVDIVNTFNCAMTALDSFSKNQPDLIITDFSMPVMDAEVFLRRLRAIPDLEETPVIVVSAHQRADNRRRALLCGATDFLTTPFDVFEFQVRVQNLLRLGLYQKYLRNNSICLKQRLTETRLRSIRASQESRERLANVIDCVPAMIFAVGDRNVCIFANEYCVEYFGSIESLRFRELARQLGRVKTYPVERVIRSSKGEDRVFLVMRRAVPQSPKRGSFVVYSCIDISTLKQTEDSLRIAKCQAEAASQAKSTFLASMSHEIRTPLTAIIGFADVLRLEIFGPLQNHRYAQYAQHILNSANHLLAIINDILEFSQTEQHNYRPVLSDFSLLDCIGSVQKMMEIELAAKGNAFTLDYESDFLLRSDPQKLSQVMLNIIANSNKFMRDGRVQIKVASVEGKEIRITIEDSGVGMTAEELEIAVSDFGRIEDPDISSPDQGIGLGLPISIRFMRLLGGRLEISSRKGTGTRVDLILPASALIPRASLEAGV